MSASMLAMLYLGACAGPLPHRDGKTHIQSERENPSHHTGDLEQIILLS